MHLKTLHTPIKKQPIDRNYYTIGEGPATTFFLSFRTFVRSILMFFSVFFIFFNIKGAGKPGPFFFFFYVTYFRENFGYSFLLVCRRAH